MRRVFAGIIALLYCVFIPFSCRGAESFSLTLGEEFAVFGKDAGIADRLHMTEEQLRDFCRENDMVYLAVNRDNTRQIRLSISTTQFSESVGSLSNLSDEKIRAVLPLLTDEAQGEIIVNNGQKFIRQYVTLSDSGGEYLLTRYITVAAKEYYVLSFYTQSGTDVSYTEQIFASFSSPHFKQSETVAKPSVLNLVFPILIALFSLGAGGIIFLLIRDIRRQTTEE